MIESSEDGRLKGKVVLVTGAANGIGNAVARVAAIEGGLVALLDYDEAAARAAAAAIDSENVFAVCADVRNLDEINGAVDEVAARFGKIDVLANVAGVMDLFAPTEGFTVATWDRVLDVNVRGTAFMMQSVLRYMLPAKSGSIVNTASTAGYKAGGGGVAYAASKGAVISLTRQAAYEVADRGIRVNAIAPGATETNFYAASSKALGGPVAEAAPFMARAVEDFGRSIALGRYADPMEIARAAVFLASDEASYITGTVLMVDGGVTI